jgi:outer membrane immunogenic protein
MNRRSNLVLASVLSVGISSFAYGQDDRTYSDLFDWSGFYVGGHVGASNISGTLESLDYCMGSGICVTDFSAVQTLLGGVAGYSVQHDTLVLGAEADINAKFGSAGSILQGFDAYQGDWMTTSQWDASIRARAGILMTPQFLGYVTGGVSAASFELANANCPGCAEWGTENLHGGTRFGWVVGVGGELAVSENTRVRVQYLHADYGTFNATVSGSGNTYASRIATDSATVGVVIALR